MRNQLVKKMTARVILLGCCLSLLPSTAAAWGRVGHRIVGRIAAKHLTIKTRAAITKILLADKSDPKGCRKMKSMEAKLACISTWADEARTSANASFHFVNIPIDAPAAQRRYDEQRDCAKQNCIVTALADFRDTLENSNNAAERAIAIKFIVHLIGDLHQPLHTARDRDRDFNNIENTTGNHVKLTGDPENDRGANAKLVTWFDETSTQYGCWNLHAVWDEGIIGRSNPSDIKYANTLNAPFALKKNAQNVAAIQSGSVIDWVNEALNLAVNHAYNLPAPIEKDKVCEVKKKDVPAVCAEYDAKTCRMFQVHYRYHLGQPYFKNNLPVVETQLAHGGLRLAGYLNSILDPASMK